jgi:hypothetical protein
VGVTARLSIVRHQVGARLVEVFLSQPFHWQFSRSKKMRMRSRIVNPADPSRAGGLSDALVEPDGLLPFDTRSAVCDAQLIAPSGLRCAPVRSPCARGCRRAEMGTLPSYTAGIASYSHAQCPRRARWPASHTFGPRELQLLRTPIPRCSGPREPSVAAAPRVVAASVLDAPSRHTAAAAATRAPRGLWARCMRTATECAPPPLERHRGAARAPPNPQVSERAKA